MTPLQFAQSIAYSSKETLLFTYECADRLKNDPGDFVECGVAAGAQIIAMATAAPDKTIWAFDSFEGIPLPSNRDDQMPGIRKLSWFERRKLPDPGSQVLETSGAVVVTEDEFKWNLLQAGINTGNIRIVKGWFENTIPHNEIKAISLLRLDGDLYYSTIICLNYLFPKVTSGGIVIIDDWKLKGCRLACQDYFRSVRYKPKYKTVSDVNYFVK